MDTRKPSRVNTVISDDLFTSVFLPVGPLREELRLKISTRWIERLAGPPASACFQQRGRDGALDFISKAKNSAPILFDARPGRLMHQGGLV
jgi:hypothetical protein